MRLQLLISFVIFLLLGPNGLAQHVCSEGRQPCYTEQDEAFEGAQRLPRQVIEVMLRTSLSKADVEWLVRTTPTPEAPGSLFRAIPVRLDEAHPQWLLAVGTAPPTSGADNGHFWLVNLSEAMPQATMLAPANYVKLLDTRHHGYNDVETGWCSPNECVYRKYKFAQGRYRMLRETETILRSRR